MSEQPKTVEPVPVQLTRMEGSINLIVERVGNVQGQLSELKTQVDTLAHRVSAVELVQAATAGSSQSWKSWLPIIIAGSSAAVAAISVLGR